jgi:hypothetical protein
MAGTSDNTAFSRRADALGLPEAFRGSGIRQTTLHWLSPSDPAPVGRLKPVRVRECKNVIGNSGNIENIPQEIKLINRVKKIMKPSLSHCLQIFPTADIDKTTQYYKLIGFKAVHYLESEEPHVCLYRDSIEIVLTRSKQKMITPNRINHGYGYDGYFITNDQVELEKEFKKLGVNIVRPLSKTDYNNKEFVFEDIDGRWIAVGNKLT